MARTNCPNCGAPIVGSACAYCGTMFERPEKALELALGRTVSVSFRDGGRLYEFDMVLDQIGIEDVGEHSTFYADGAVYQVFHSPEYEASMRGRIVPNSKHGRECLVVARDLEQGSGKAPRNG